MIYEVCVCILQCIFLNLFLICLSINFIANVLMMAEACFNEAGKVQALGPVGWKGEALRTGGGHTGDLLILCF